MRHATQPRLPGRRGVSRSTARTGYAPRRGADEVPARRIGSFRGTGTTSAPTCRARRCRAAPGHGAAGRAGRSRAALPDGADPPGGQRGRRRSRSPTRCSTSTACGGRRRSTARARLEQALGTRSRIFYKYEGTSPAGSHKPNTAVAQAYYNKQRGPHAPRDRDRRGPVGQRARVRLQADRPRVQGLHGPRSRTSRSRRGAR